MTATKQRQIEHGSVRGYRAGCHDACCRAAHARYERRMRESLAAKTGTAQRIFPVAPFLAELARQGRSLSSLGAAVDRSIHRAKSAGLTVDGADLAACALGRHPSEIWPDWWAA